MAEANTVAASIEASAATTDVAMLSSEIENTAEISAATP
jgi:hypothetical protein